MNRIFNAFCIIIGLLFTGVAAVVAMPVFLINENAGHGVQRFWGRALLRLMAIRVHWENLNRLENLGPAVLTPNHESAFDIFVMASIPINFKWLAKKQVAGIPLVGWAMKTMGCFFVERKGTEKDLNVMHQVEEGLKSGRSTLIFPEGTRTRTGDLLPFKKGAFRTAQNTGVPLIPIGIYGTFAIAPPNTIPKRRGHKVYVRIGHPMKILPEDNLIEKMDRFREELMELRLPPQNLNA